MGTAGNSLIFSGLPEKKRGLNFSGSGAVTHIATMAKFETCVVCKLVLIRQIDELRLMEGLGNVAFTNGVSVIVSIACCLDVLLQVIGITEVNTVGLICVLLLGVKE